jgi:mutator protein MutT
VGRRYPAWPVVGVAGVVLAGERVLLVRRANPPSQGLWSLPGGAVEVGEGLAAALVREVREETGITARVGPLVEVVERIQADRSGGVEYHYVLLDYLCSAEPAEPLAADDAADARWVELARLDEAGLTPDTARVVRKAASLARQRATSPM